MVGLGISTENTAKSVEIFFKHIISVGMFLIYNLRVSFWIAIAHNHIIDNLLQYILVHDTVQYMHRQNNWKARFSCLFEVFGGYGKITFYFIRVFSY
jgi:hypothetical protein